MIILIKKVLDFLFSFRVAEKPLFFFLFFFQHATQWFLGTQPLPSFQDQALIYLISGNLETRKTGFLPENETRRFCCLDQKD